MHQRGVTLRTKSSTNVGGAPPSSLSSSSSPWHSKKSNSKRSMFSQFLFTLCLLIIFGTPALVLYHSTQISYADNNSLRTTQQQQQQHQQQSSTRASEKPPIQVAHAISLISCHKQSRVKGFLDALMILRHSIHQNSIHRLEDNGKASKQKKASRYSYQMYAILHKDGGCLTHVPLLKRLGYIPLVKDTPVNISDIPESSWYRNHVENENCCGSKEFIKLYAYTLTDHPVVVHWDLDVLVLQPLDDLYNAMLLPETSKQGQEARERLAIQKPQYQQLPSQIDAFFTRDITSAAPWETITAVQGGFVVARPSMEHFQMYRKFILEANYTPGTGRGPGSGWGGLGYGGFQGAMAYQGVLAYFYDVIYPRHSVELDVCKWNQVVADVIWRGPRKREQHFGQCRDHPIPGTSFEDNTPEKGQCYDCRTLPVEQTMTAHYTACKKPWECTIPHPRVPRNPAETERLKELTNITTCGALFREYFDFRKDIEMRIGKVLGSPFPETSPKGNYHPDYFRGYCAGPQKYLAMELPDDFDMKQVYGF